MKLSRTPNSAATRLQLEQLLGQHKRIQERHMELRLDEFLERLQTYRSETAPAFRAYRKLRQRIAERERKALRLDELKPRPLTSFVRNRLINEVYLPLIGDNFAKQMGTAGEDKRTDLMGMLLLISPPGYGKTTLMEYIAQRLGLIFVKVNCPTIGHQVISLDPQEAPNATARQELEKLNLALEMGNNVMLYLDDIQHSNPEFLQKFISLADAQRRIEGIWRGRTRTYDLRGKRFCVAMAGNPYTESGEMFKIPDMLANRADIYNLGDVLSGKQAAFELSYIENALTSNAALAPLATRDPEDLYRLIRIAQGETVASNEFSHNYSATELREMTEVLKKLLRIQSVVLKVNQQYIASAAQAEDYREEPPFKLQGSYRNMNKLAEKVVAVMNDAELEDLITDHYTGEAQTLTSGAEENLLKLAQLRGRLTPEQAQRWEAIKDGFKRRQTLGDTEDDPARQLVRQVNAIAASIDKLQRTLLQAAKTRPTGDSAAAALAPEAFRGMEQHLQTISSSLQQSRDSDALQAGLNQIAHHLQQLKPVLHLNPNIAVNTPLPERFGEALQQLVETIDKGLLPIAQGFERKSRMDLVLWGRLKEVSDTLKEVHKMNFDQQKRR